LMLLLMLIPEKLILLNGPNKFCIRGILNNLTLIYAIKY